MKPFVLLSIRAEPAAAKDEYASFLRFSGLTETELPLVRLAEAELPALDLDEWSGILLGGGPWNASDEPETKSVAQRRSERSIAALLDDVVELPGPARFPSTDGAAVAQTGEPGAGARRSAR